MTNEEAIIDIRENIQPIVGGKSLDIAISAIEKQIPKKVVEKNIVEDVSLNYCPYCNSCFIGWGMKHCGECGQALDWSGTE